MSEGSEYILGLKDETSGPAKKAKEALAHLKDQLKATEQSIKSLKDAQQRFKQSGLKDEVKASRDAIARMRDKSSDLKGTIKETTGSLKEMTSGTDAAGGSMLQAGAAGGAMGAAIGVGTEIFKKIGAAAQWAGEQLIHWTVEAAKVAIEAGAMKERLVAMYDYFGAGKGQEIFAKLDALGTAIHVPTEKVHEYAKDLIQSGIEGQNRIEQTVKTVAMLQKVAGDDAANKIKGLIEESAKTQKTDFWKGGRGTFTVTREQLVGTGVTIDQVFDSLAKRTKLGVGQVKQQMMMGQITAAQGIDALNDVIERGKVGDTARNMTGDLTQAFTELKDNIGKILKDVDFKGFIKEVSQFAKLFDPLTESGKTTKSILTNVFNTIFDVAKKGVRAAKLGFLDLQIAGLELYVFLIPQIKQFKKLSGELQNNAGVALVLKAAWTELKGAFIIAAYGVKVLFNELNGVLALANAMGNFVANMKRHLDDLGEALNLKSLGSGMIDGLVQGIKDGAAAVKDAVVGVVKGGVDAGKAYLKIGSPSKLTKEMGKNTAEGFHKGVDDAGGAPGFGMKAPMPALGPSGGGGTGPISIQVDVEITGVKGAEDAMDMFRAKMTDVLEQIADGLGGKVLPAA